MSFSSEGGIMNGICADLGLCAHWKSAIVIGNYRVLKRYWGAPFARFLS